ncbi:hypothetical protein ACX8XP_18520 [Calditrichota bacterium LG25]
MLTAQYHPLGGAACNVTKLNGQGNIVWTSPDFDPNAWRIKVGTNGKVFVSSGALIEFNSTTGEIVHVQNIGNNLSRVTDVVATDNRIYIAGATAGNLYSKAVAMDWFVAAYDENYNFLWGTQYNNNIPDSVEDYDPVIAFFNDIIYLGGSYGWSMQWLKDGLAAFNAGDGSFLWFIDLVGSITHYIYSNTVAIAADENGIYYGNFDPAPIKVSHNGQVEWRLPYNCEDLDVHNGVIYFLKPPPESNKIFLFDAETGVPLN